MICFHRSCICNSCSHVVHIFMRTTENKLYLHLSLSTLRPPVVQLDICPVQILIWESNCFKNGKIGCISPLYSFSSDEKFVAFVRRLWFFVFLFFFYLYQIFCVVRCCAFRSFIYWNSYMYTCICNFYGHYKILHITVMLATKYVQRETILISSFFAVYIIKCVYTIFTSITCDFFLPDYELNVKEYVNDNCKIYFRQYFPTNYMFYGVEQGSCFLIWSEKHHYNHIVGNSDDIWYGTERVETRN